MSEGTGPPGPEWFEEIAHHSGVIFYALRIHPDVAFEYLGSAPPTGPWTLRRCWTASTPNPRNRWPRPWP